MPTLCMPYALSMPLVSVSQAYHPEVFACTKGCPTHHTLVLLFAIVSQVHLAWHPGLQLCHGQVCTSLPRCTCAYATHPCPPLPRTTLPLASTCFSACERPVPAYVRGHRLLKVFQCLLLPCVLLGGTPGDRGSSARPGREDPPPREGLSR